MLHRKKVRHVLVEEAIIFLVDENYAFNIDCSKMKLKLKDKVLGSLAEL